MCVCMCMSVCVVLGAQEEDALDDAGSATGDADDGQGVAHDAAGIAEADLSLVTWPRLVFVCFCFVGQVAG